MQHKPRKTPNASEVSAKSVCSGLLLGLMWLGASAAGFEMPAFKLLATRRYVLDNERVLAELRPETVFCADVQHPPMAPFP